MKRSALCLVFGVALAASSAIASADTAASPSGSITNAIANWLYCTLGNQSYCITPETGGSDPTINNK